MEALDPNTVNELSLTFPHWCIAVHPHQCPPFIQCVAGLMRGTIEPMVAGQQDLIARLGEHLKNCSNQFYEKCLEFDRISRHCEFEPAIEAAKFKEQALLDRVAKLEARVKELEPQKRGTA